MTPDELVWHRRQLDRTFRVAYWAGFIAGIVASALFAIWCLLLAGCGSEFESASPIKVVPQSDAAVYDVISDAAYDSGVGDAAVDDGATEAGSPLDCAAYDWTSNPLTCNNLNCYGYAACCKCADCPEPPRPDCELSGYGAWCCASKDGAP